MPTRLWTAALLLAISTASFAEPDRGSIPASDAGPIPSRPGAQAGCHGKLLAPLGKDGKPLYGLVLVSMRVGVDGQLSDIALKNSNNKANAPALFAAVEKWLQGCRYAPLMKDGKAYPVTRILPFTFRAPK